MEKSKIPTSCTQTESTVIPLPVSTMWPKFKAFAFNELAPKMFKSVTYEPSCCTGQVGALITLEYKDGAKWKISVTEISDKNLSLGYEVREADPVIPVTSVQGEIKLFAVTETNQTFVQWTTEYSNDVDIQVIQDQKFKKHDFFAALKDFK